MNGRAISLTIVAFLLGALAAGGVSVRVIREVNTVDDATSLPPSNIAPEVDPASGYQIDPKETLIGSAGLIPDVLAIKDDELRISYGLFSLAPQLSGLSFDVDPIAPNGMLSPIYPKTWVIETSGGAIEGGTANVVARTARFDVDPSLLATDIESVTITDALAPFPVTIPFVLSEAEPVVDIGFGYTVELVRVVEQTQNTIVQVQVSNADPSRTGLHLSGAGPGWSSGAVGADLGGRTTLTWSGGALPDEIALRAADVLWLPIDGEFVVTLDGGQ